jgi:hypothetical protein
MYEKPKMNRVGDAKDVILGIIPTGDDIDMNDVPGEEEWAYDGGDRNAISGI